MVNLDIKIDTNLFDSRNRDDIFYVCGDVIFHQGESNIDFNFKNSDCMDCKLEFIDLDKNLVEVQVDWDKSSAGVGQVNIVVLVDSGIKVG